MQYIIGIDEVGRGSLAGPVVVAAAAVPRGLGSRIGGLSGLKDSKQLSEKQRERWFAYFKNHRHIHYAAAWVYPKAIDRMNISRAANLAALRAAARLAKACRMRLNAAEIFLDGGLFLGNGAKRMPAKTVVRGDEKITAITAASIVAKVVRDRAMRRMGKRYRLYGFEIHKGYGTSYHLRAIRKYGPSVAHRLTFLS